MLLRASRGNVVVEFGFKHLEAMFEALRTQQAGRDPDTREAEIRATSALVYSDFPAGYPARVADEVADGDASIEPHLRARSLA